MKLFAKILDHDLEESFRDIFKEVKKTISQLMSLYIKGKKPYARENDLKALVI